MALTQRQKDIIDRKKAALYDALRRQPLKDYFEGWCHVTLNTRGEAPTCGYIVGNAEAADGSADAPRVVLTEVGKGVDKSGRAYMTSIRALPSKPGW